MLSGLPMNRQTLLQQLARHRPFNEHEARMRERMAAFVEAHEDCFERSLAIGHVTGSAWVVNTGRTHVLLTHHAKLNKWLQPGGHADGDPDILRVALREAREESGLKSLRAFSEEIFDVDAHDIPARGAEAAHTHYDIRFLLEAEMDEPLEITDESHDLAWVPLTGVARLNTDESVLRMVARTHWTGTR
jgi:8-oxo-dGTP pyrophosphatase MutT (NUDIX family)